MNATLIASASIRRDGEARWAGHRRRKPVHGHQAHVATNRGAGLVRSVEVTMANIHDATELEAVLSPEPEDVYADSALNGGPAERLIIAPGRPAAHVWTGIWGRGPEALARLEAQGKPHASFRRCHHSGSQQKPSAFTNASGRAVKTASGTASSSPAIMGSAASRAK